MLQLLLAITVTGLAGTVDKCEVSLLEDLLQACNLGCCFSPTCSCYNMTHESPVKHHLNTGKWCVWSFCVITAIGDCPIAATNFSNTYLTARNWEQVCNTQLDLYECGLSDYTKMLDCLEHKPCWKEMEFPALCGTECVNETLDCQKSAGCAANSVKTCEHGYGLADQCNDMCGDCLSQSCEALLFLKGHGINTFKYYILPAILAVSVATCCFAIVFFCKWRMLHKKMVATTPAAQTPEHAPTNEKLPQSQFLSIKDQWQRGNLVGRGQYGAVYIAILPGGHVLAVKQIDAVSVATDPVARTAYLHEIESLQSLYHPNIVMYYGASFDPEARLINLFMEYVSGGSLAKFVKNLPGTLPEEAGKAYIKQVLRGLEYLHSHNIVHRDIKGDNILINHQEGIVKITDFGSSRKIHQTIATMPGGTLTGTPNWMAPEMITSQLYEEIPFKKKLDVWSVGCTVVEMLNRGRPPWPTFTSHWAALFHIANSTEVPDGIPEHITVECKSFITMCLKRSVEERAAISDLLEHEWLSDSALNFKFDAKSIHDPDLASMNRDWKKLSFMQRSQQQQQQQEQRMRIISSENETDAAAISAYLNTCAHQAISSPTSEPTSPSPLPPPAAQ
eukprot:TRINITY_DN11148_c0_g1_i1.p1 TRINITY_DN11148_c0_g1~~TRINITY_DN11148_c0_g1_i1.p1  ORF type:complete len:618 (+),score=83.88 TRINITY_DN11148_c0_g1_i1:54-1907(+)